MKIFNLPDLGEGLAEAEIHEWHVKVGDEVKVDQPMVSVETAKAVVEVPVPQTGKIAKLFGKAGDIIQTDAPLVAFESSGEDHKDNGSVVGSLEETATVLNASDMIIGAAKSTTSAVKAMPIVRNLAKQLNIDLNLVTATGSNGQITIEDVKKYSNPVAKQRAPLFQKTDRVEALHGVRRVMAMTMAQSHQEVVPVTVMDEADITNLSKNGDITVCLIQAIAAGIKAEPALNAWYDGQTLERCLLNEINLGLAVDTAEGLFVPVIKGVAERTAAELREDINKFKTSVRNRTVAPSDFHGATITLSNFGMIAGRYANPIIVPPMVAILGCGKIRDIVAVREGKMAICRSIPLSLTFDHRAVTGGEATRFLAAVIQFLEAQI